MQYLENPVDVRSVCTKRPVSGRRNRVAREPAEIKIDHTRQKGLEKGHQSESKSFDQMGEKVECCLFLTISDNCHVSIP